MHCLLRIMLVLALIGVVTATIGVASTGATAGYRPDLPLTRHHDASTPPALLDAQAAAVELEATPTPRLALPDLYALCRAVARRALGRVAAITVQVALAVVACPRKR